MFGKIDYRFGFELEAFCRGTPENPIVLPPTEWPHDGLVNSNTDKETTDREFVLIYYGKLYGGEVYTISKLKDEAAGFKPPAGYVELKRETVTVEFDK